MISAPLWWFVISGICFLISVLFNVALIVGGIVAWGRVSPALSELRQQIHRLGDQTSDIASTAKSTVENVHDRTEQILGSAQEASAVATHRIGAASAALTVIFVAARIAAFMRMLSGRRHLRRRFAA